MYMCIVESWTAVLSNLSVLPQVFNSHQFETHQTMRRLPWCLAQTQMLLQCFSSLLFFFLSSRRNLTVGVFGFRWGSWRAPMNTWAWREQEEARRCWWVTALSHTIRHIVSSLNIRKDEGHLLFCTGCTLKKRKKKRTTLFHVPF